MFKLDLEKAEEPEIKLPTSVSSQKKQEDSRTSTSALLTTLKPLAVWITANCEKFLKTWYYQTTLPASCETSIQVEKEQLELDMEQQTGSNWERSMSSCILLPCLVNLYAEYIMRNVGLDEAQAEIKIAGRNIKNLRYSDDTTLMAKSEAELKSLLMKVKQQNETADLKFYIQKTKILASGLISSWQIDGETVETVTDYYFGLQNHCKW